LLFFYFWIEAGRSDICLKTSGHWFYYVLTTLCYLWALSHFITTDGWSNLTRWFIAYTVAYQAVMLRILTTTQRFYHDPEEARYAIRLAVYLIPFAGATGFLTLGFNGLTSCTWQSLIEGVQDLWAPHQISRKRKKSDDFSTNQNSVSDNNYNSDFNNMNVTIDYGDQPSTMNRNSNTLMPPPMDDAAPPPPPDVILDMSSLVPSSPPSGGLLDDIKKVKLKPKPPPTQISKPLSNTGQTDLMAAIAAKLKERRGHVEDWDTED